MGEVADIQDPAFHIMTVCTMNICRSPALEAVLRRHIQCARLPSGSVVVNSAGTHAVPGAPCCDISLAMVGEITQESTARELTGAALVDVDLVITAARTHSAAVLAVRPQLRSACFTARQAGRLARWVVDAGVLDVAQRKAAGELVEVDREIPQTLAEPLPPGVSARLRWLVTEMDAARGLAPLTDSVVRSPAHEPDDIPDPHVVGYNVHRMSADMILSSIGELTRSAAVILAAA